MHETQEIRWHVFQKAAHERAGNRAAQLGWAQSLDEQELAFYAARAAGWVAVATHASVVSPDADRHHTAVSQLAQVCSEVYAKQPAE